MLPTQFANGRRDPGRWLVPFFLLIGVLTPAACVLWFLNVAVNNERDASHRKLEDAYRGQLKLLRDRVDSWWDKRSADLEREARDATGQVVFARLVTQGLADSVITLGYPAAAEHTATDTVALRQDWAAAHSLESQAAFRAAADSYAAIAKTEPDISIAARAVQARIRCLTRANDKLGAIQAIAQDFTRGRLMGGRDLRGRLIALDEQLLAVRLLDPNDPRAESATRRLHDLVADYSGPPIPAAQRLFLMDELGAPGFATYAAERLAAQFLEASRNQAGDGTLSSAGLPGIWKFTPPGTGLIALYRTATVTASMRALSAGLNVALAVTPPGAPPPSSDEWMPAGSALPGWQISLSLPGGQFDALAHRRIASYVWIGLLAITAVAVCALLAGQVMRRQWQVARLKTDLVAAVSHELRTPVASVRVLVDTLLADENPGAAKTRDYLELIGGENLRLSRLIENFLAFSRLERNRQQFEFSEVAPAHVIETVLTAHRAAVFSVAVAPNLPHIRADEDALVTVLRNLLDNAWKYTPADEKRIAVRVYREKTRVIFAVEDNGIGIAHREQKRIFRRFYQVDRSLTRDTGGCGLGLSIVEYIVRAHGGAVRVQSRPGQGSTFFVAVPEAA